MTNFTHIPVLLDESIKYLDIKENQVIVDGTLGLGGHAEAILQKMGKNSRLIGIDRDEEAISMASERLKGFKNRFTAIKDNFLNIKSALNNAGIHNVDGILLDLGLSSLQIDSADRGFSLRKDGPLDMRMDKSQKLSAADIVNGSTQEELGQIIREFGEEKLFKRIARGLVEQRKKERINSTIKFAEAVKKSIPRMNPKNELNIITRVFQAVRIKVNNELGNLETVLKDLIDLLNSGGRIVIISYHSLEDRIVKHMFRTESKECLCPPKQIKCTCNHKQKLAIITRKPVIPDSMEMEINPKSRSAKLRAAEKV